MRRINEHQYDQRNNTLKIIAWKDLKVGLSPSEKNFLFASIIALQKWWKMLFISS